MRIPFLQCIDWTVISNVSLSLYLEITFHFQVPWSQTSSEPRVHIETKEKEVKSTTWMYTWFTLPSLSRTCLEVLPRPTHWSRTNGWLWILLLNFLTVCANKTNSFLHSMIKRILIFIFSLSCILYYKCHDVSFQMVCSKTAAFSCQNLCGNLLGCGNHYCSKPCHALRNQSLIADRNVRTESCEECHLPCQKVPPTFCSAPLFSLSYFYWWDSLICFLWDTGCFFFPTSLIKLSL